MCSDDSWLCIALTSSASGLHKERERERGRERGGGEREGEGGRGRGREREGERGEREGEGGERGEDDIKLNIKLAVQYLCCSWTASLSFLTSCSPDFS